MAATTQVNFRIPVDIKHKAQLKAERYWTNLNFLMKLFLTKFAKEDNVVEVFQDVNMENIFDEWFVSYFMSDEGKKNIKETNDVLMDIVSNEDKYLV